MTEEFEPITGCVHHEVKCIGPGRFRVRVYRDSVMHWDANDEPYFTGGVLVATLYRATEALADGAGIAYSFVTSGPDKFHGVTGPDYGKGRKAKREEI